MRVVVFGAGAMGSIFGAALARSGADIVFFDKNPDVVAAINREGLRLSGVFGEIVLKAQATTAADELGRADLALVLVDSAATAAVAPIAAACLGPEGVALTIQNGIGNWETLVEALGRNRVMAGSTFNSGAGLGPGRAAHTNLGPTVIGAVGGASGWAERIAATFEGAGLPFTVSDNIDGHVWSKFVHNCAINPVSAVTGLRPGEIARTPDAAKLLDRILEEVLAVVAAAGVRLPEDDPGAHIRDHCWERYNRPSMLQHLEAGRRTEIDALNGALVRRAWTLGVPVPVNETIVVTVKALESAAGRRGDAIDEAGLERAARENPRRGRWG